MFSRNFAELGGDKETNTAYFDGVQAAVLYVYMISPWNTWLPLGLWREEYWKYWAELIWNIAGLFGRQTLSVSCSFRRQILHLVGFRGRRKSITICGKFAVVSRGILKKLPRKTVVTISH